MKINIEISGIVAPGHSIEMIKELTSVYPDNSSSVTFGATLLHTDPRISVIEDILKSYGLRRRSLDPDITWDDPDVYGWKRMVSSFTEKDMDRAQYFLFAIDTPGDFAFKGDAPRPGICPLHRLYANTKYRTRASPFPDMAYAGGGQAPEVVSDRLRQSIDDAGLVGVDFLPVQLDKGSWSRSIPCDWSDYNLPRYWGLSSTIHFPARSNQWSQMEVEGLRHKEDLKWTVGIWKFDKAALDVADVEPFDIALDVKFARPLGPEGPASAGVPIVSRRFLDVCREAGVKLEPYPVFVLDNDGTPIRY